MLILAVIAGVSVFASVIILGWKGLYLALVLLICIGSFAYALYLVRWIFTHDDSNAAMRVISDAIKEGSEGFLNTQYTAIAYIGAAFAALLFGRWEVVVSAVDCQLNQFCLLIGDM